MDRNDKIKDILEQRILPLNTIESVEDICIHVVDDEGRTICYSKGCEKIEGQSKENILGKTLEELYTFANNPDNPHGSIQMKVLETGNVMKNQHVKYTSQNGRDVDAISSTYPVFNDDKSKVLAAICVFRDIKDYVSMANRINKLEHELLSAQTKTRKNGTIYDFKDIIGNSKVIKNCIKESKRASKSNTPILIYGKTGTGKEVFAQSIHNNSFYSKGPFIGINCSAIPENLLESTLFGTCKGAYTGAEETDGLFQAATNGTLFLDEINSMSKNLQAKLLRVLETNTVRKVGKNIEIPVNARIISATNEDPIDAVKKNVLRPDLYYRLAGITITLPSLTERRKDIKDLVDFFIVNQSRILGKKIDDISENAYKILLAHNWPGNVRELKHVVDHALNIADLNSTIIQNHNLPKYLCENNANNLKTKNYSLDGKDLKSKLKNIEKELIIEAYEKNEENISQTARNLGTTRQNIQHKLKDYGLR